MISDVEEITGIRELKKFSKTNKNIYLMTKRILDLILSKCCISQRSFLSFASLYHRYRFLILPNKARKGFLI